MALGAQKLKIPAIIVMPTTTPAIKVRSVKARGAQVVLHGDSFDEAFEKEPELVTEYGYTYLHPFDDADVIAGQGTVAVELLRQLTRPIDAVFIPVGGGGLAAGMAAYIKYVRPEIKLLLSSLRMLRVWRLRCMQEPRRITAGWSVCRWGCRKADREEYV